MIEKGSIKRRNFMTAGIPCGIALLAGLTARAAAPAERPGRRPCSEIRRLMREYGAEFGGPAAVLEN